MNFSEILVRVGHGTIKEKKTLFYASLNDAPVARRGRNAGDVISFYVLVFFFRSVSLLAWYGVIFLFPCCINAIDHMMQSEGKSSPSGERWPCKSLRIVVLLFPSLTIYLFLTFSTVITFAYV